MNILIKLSKLVAIGLILSLSASGCALIFQGTTENISVTSEPSGATVTTSDGVPRVTPFTMTAPREQDLQFHFSKPGYQSTDVLDRSKVEPEFLVPDIIPFMIPWAIDAGSGAGFEHDRTSVTARLDPDPSVSQTTKDSSTDKSNDGSKASGGP